MYQSKSSALIFSAFALILALPFVRSAAAAESGSVTMTVTAVGKKDTKPPAVTRGDVQLHEGKEIVQVADWRRSDTLFLAILIDDSLDTEIANQWSDLKSFFAAQPENTYISVAYARNGAAVVAQDFTRDHALAAKALRIPLGNAEAFTSPYLALQDWIKRWPDSNERKSILLFSSGIDYFRGGFDTVDPDVDTTIEQAQKKNINIWTIYSTDAGHRLRSGFPVFIAQGFLSRVSQESGAESFYLGFGPPVSLKPYLDELDTHLRNQYLLSFVANGGAKGKFERVRVTTELPGTELFAAPQAYIPPSQ